MYTITVETTFKAKHQLTLTDGSLEDLHEHDWVVRAAVSVSKLDKAGLAIDFHELKKKVEKITSSLNGGQLESVAHFHGINASAENLAKYIYDKLESVLANHVKLRYVETGEEPGYWAKYSI